MAQVLLKYHKYYLYFYHVVAAQAPPRGIPMGVTLAPKASTQRPEPPHP
jgi:hypothetical protein